MRIWGLSAFVALGALVACSDMSASAFDLGPGAAPSAGDQGDGGFRTGDNAGGQSTPSPALGPTDNGVILVHAAGTSAFRLCFESEMDRLPQPDAQLMPDANVVGVDVGTAVRIGPLDGPPGKIYLFEEPLIRYLYPQGKGPTCQVLQDNHVPYHELTKSTGPVTTDLSHGVHLLVVAGCTGDAGSIKHTKAECGADYDGTQPDGNIHVVERELKGGTRTDLTTLPSQVIHLSQALESARTAAGATLAVSFGDVKSTTSSHTTVVSGPQLFGAPKDFTTPPKFDPTTESIYADVGFRVTLTPTAGGTPTFETQQSLADVQKMSAPREIPSTYYAAASNYVLLLLGDPAPKTEDGGVDSDPFRNVHMLAVPVIEPKPDAGAGDGGSASDAGPEPDGSL